MTTTFAIKTETFEGPMELLIELVEKRKLLINDISLAEVTDEYMQTVSTMQELSLPNTAQFITLAATLLLIKSKSLLPVLDLTSEETTSIKDLEERLRYYKIYHDAGMQLQTTFGSAIMYAPEYKPPHNPVFLPDTFCDTSKLADAMSRLLSNLPKTEVKPVAKIKPTISLEDMIIKLQKRLEQQVNTSFFKIRSTEPEHKNVIVSFLAILELFKTGNIIVTQANRFGDIDLESEKINTPRYY